MSTPIKTVQNDENGNIVFPDLEFNTANETTFYVVMKDPMDESLIYDKDPKKVKITVTDENLKHVSLDEIFYAYSPEGNHITLSKEKAGNDLIAFCLNFHKLQPPVEVTDRQYISLGEASNEEISKMVTHNLWGEELTKNLKKILYYFQINPDAYTIDEQKNIFWAATGSYGPDKNSMEQYQEELDKIFKVSLPKDYRLVALKAKNMEWETDEDTAIYQSVVVGYFADIKSDVPVFTVTKKEEKKPDVVVDNNPIKKEEVEKPQVIENTTSQNIEPQQVEVRKLRKVPNTAYVNNVNSYLLFCILSILLFLGLSLKNKDI